MFSGGEHGHDGGLRGDKAAVHRDITAFIALYVPGPWTHPAFIACKQNRTRSATRTPMLEPILRLLTAACNQEQVIEILSNSPVQCRRRT